MQRARAATSAAPARRTARFYMSRNNCDNLIEADNLKSERKKYQRRLIPANIIVIIIALVAAAFQFFMPMIRAGVTLNSQSVEYINSMMGEQSGGEMDEEQSHMLSYVLQDIDARVTVEISPLDVLSLGAMPQAQTVRDFIAGAADGVEGAVESMLAQATPRLAAYTVAQAVEALPEEYADAPVEDIEEVVSLINEGQYDDAKAQLRTSAEQFAASIGYELTEEQLDAIGENFDKLIDEGVDENGQFSYTQAFEAVAGEQGVEIPDLTGFVGDMLAQISDDDARMTGTALFGVAAVTIGFTSALWLVMALIAFIRIFTPNKRFTMWYVKLFCWLPCVLFVALPFAAVALAPMFSSLVGAEASAAFEMLASLPVSFGGSGIVSGICLALLWLVSIFWLFPIKRRIRRLNKMID